MRFHIKSLNYHHYACTMPTMPVLCPLCLLCLFITTASDPREKKVFDWVISSDLLPLNDSDIPTFLHRSSGNRSSPDISFTPCSLAISCSWKVLQDLGSDHLRILLTVPLSPVFRTSHERKQRTNNMMAGKASRSTSYHEKTRINII